jgi:hypothetical protein
MDALSLIETPPVNSHTERLAYSVQEATDMLGVNYLAFTA